MKDILTTKKHKFMFRGFQKNKYKMFYKLVLDVALNDLIP